MCRTCNSRGRDMREPEDGPYTRKSRVRDDGEDTKYTALVREPETFFMDGMGWGPVDWDHEGTRRILRMSNNCWAKPLDLYCLSKRRNREHGTVGMIIEDTRPLSTPS